MTEKPGATGNFPDGKLNGHEEGELRVAVGVEGDNVVITLGTPVTWFGFPPEQAVEFAQTIIKHARTVARRAGRTLTVLL